MEKNYEPKNIVRIFTEGVKNNQPGDVSIIKLHNGKDCFILDIPEDIKAKFKENFGVQDGETILLARDTSKWNNKKEGLVITDKRIIFIPSNEDISKYTQELGAYHRVTYSADSLLFWSTEENYFSIPKCYFSKSRFKSYDTDDAIKQLSKLLTTIAQIMGG